MAGKNNKGIKIPNKPTKSPPPPPPKPKPKP